MNQTLMLLFNFLLFLSVHQLINSASVTKILWVTVLMTEMKPIIIVISLSNSLVCLVGVVSCSQLWHPGMWCQTMPSS